MNSSLHDKRIVAVISMNLSKAFDSMPHGLWLGKLKAYGVNRRSCLLLEDYLRGSMPSRVKVGNAFSDSCLVLSHFFVNDLFGLQIKTVQLNMCADYGHLLNLRYGSGIFGRAYLI